MGKLLLPSFVALGLLLGATGCAAQTGEASTPPAVTSSMSPTITKACGSVALALARNYGEGALLESGFVGTQEEVAAWAATRAETADSTLKSPAASLYALCYFTGVNVAVPHPKPSSGTDQPYTVVGILVDPAGTPSLYSVARAGLISAN